MCEIVIGSKYYTEVYNLLLKGESGVNLHFCPLNTIINSELLTTNQTQISINPHSNRNRVR